MMRRGSKRMRGFTLIEILVVAALFLVLGAALLVSLLTGQASYLSADAYILVQEEARKAFDNMVRELRESGTISCGAAGNECPTAGSTSRRLNFQIARGYNTEVACQNPPAICWGDETATARWVHYIITSATTGAQLVRCTSTLSTTAFGDYIGCRVLANSVNGVTSNFSWNSAAANRTVTSRLQITYTNPRLSGGQQQTPLLISTVRLRN